MMANGICISALFGWAVSTSERVRLNRSDDGSLERRRVEAAGIVDAENAPTNSLENAPIAFSTAPTRIIVIMVSSKKLLPMSPDRFVT